MKYCENCGLDHTGDYGSGRFCSVKCSRAFSTKAKRSEINAKLKDINETKSKIVEIICKQCNKSTTVKYYMRNKKFCSRSCKARYECLKKKDILSIHFKKLSNARYKSNDLTIGWKTRSNLRPSYPEKITMEILDSLSISYIREYKIGKYFVDFLINSIALEIDGGQHKYRRDLDKIKDDYLESNNLTVIRIDWDNGINFKNRLVEKLSIIKQEVTGS